MQVRCQQARHLQQKNYKTPMPVTQILKWKTETKKEIGPRFLKRKTETKIEISRQVGVEPTAFCLGNRRSIH